MSAVFCCPSISPFRPRQLDHELKFSAFMKWAKKEPSPGSDSSLVPSAPYAIQVVKQVNYGPQESIRYFVPNDLEFREATEDALLEANFEKVNSYKNFRCTRHDKFFELNFYQKNATNTHHWRSNLARPSRDIDLAFRKENPTPVSPVITSQDPALTTITKSDNTEEGAVNYEPPIVGKSRSECVTPGTRRALQMLLPHLQKGLMSSGPTSGDMRHNIQENGLGIFDPQEVVKPAVDYFEHLYESDAPHPPGCKCLQALVDKVLATGRRDGVGWVVRFGHLVEKVMEAGVPGEEVAKVLYHSGRHSSRIIVKEWEEEDDSGEKPTDRDGKDWRTELDNEEAGDDYGDSTRDVYWDHLDEDNFRHSSWRGSSPSSNKDFTACDQECGYCGVCDY
ncbi:hypothetical protein QBC37DRAFT_447851 [Rhypophila decipiens]|uniref:Uncharacterized protein n=1 Tax=Rhypophila decipiens TaxID=261697 RepID=A0AAN6Y1R3_9PEZI|nr:hypothetical protein QBC37DRAFT_447851 [Rhypophila decipiens]